jgi:disulfide bond formation protein DsbB
MNDMILTKISLRNWYFIVAACCGGLVGYALYTQHVDFLEPCPLCIIQRVAYMWIGGVALLAAIHYPRRTGRNVYSWMMVLGASLGTAVAGRHVWMQHLPADLVPECGPGLNYMLDNFPLGETFQSVFFGSGSCAEVKWTFMGLSMPEWSLIWFIGLGVFTLWFSFRRVEKGINI